MKKDDCKKNVASLEGRLQTFKKCVNKLKYEIQVYSEAGYYYTGTYSSLLLLLNFNIR